MIVVYKLERYEISLLQSINCQLDTLYSDEIAEELRTLLLQVISTCEIKEEQLERLVELLPQFKAPVKLETQSVKEDEEFLSEWPGWENTSIQQRRRKILFLHHLLENRLFTQYTVYQKQLLHGKTHGFNREH